MVLQSKKEAIKLGELEAIVARFNSVKNILYVKLNIYIKTNIHINHSILKQRFNTCKLIVGIPKIKIEWVKFHFIKKSYQ